MIMSSSHYLIQEVLTHILPFASSKILDAACGKGKWGFLIKVHSENAYVIGLDLSIENLFIAKRSRAYDDLIMSDIKHLPFRNKAIDTSLACEVIEHLTKTDGALMIREMMRITRIRILITTPHAEWWFDSKSRADGHITKWHPKELRKFGFKVRGIGSRFRLKGKFAWLLRQFIFNPASYIIPEIGEFLIAIK